MLLKIRILFVVLNVVYGICRRLLLLICKKPPSIPPITDSVYMLSATTLAKKIRQKEITSYEVVQAYINRIKDVNPFINAVIDERFVAAIDEAKNYDKQFKEGKIDVETLEKEKPLYGVPITVKECCAVTGCSYTGCTLSRKGIKANHDAVIIQLVRNAGAIPLCVTNTPEMCSGFESTNYLHGRTRNPYDARYSAGGSSGGEGALLGAGGSVIGIGSDLGGSIRMPAFLNGIFGHKPTSGIIPSEGHFPYSDDKFFQMLLTFGPMARYAEDLSLLMKVMTSKCNHDLRLDVPVNLQQIKIYYRECLDQSFGVLPMTNTIKKCIVNAANHFAQQGVRVEKLPIEWPVTLTEMMLVGFLNIKNPPPLLIDSNNPKDKKNPVTELIKSFFGLSRYTKQLLLFATLLDTHFPLKPLEISHYTKKGQELRQKLLDLLGDDGVFIYPTFRGSVLPQLIAYELLSLSSLGFFNIIGFPAAHVPMGLDHAGMPIGVQIIAAPYQDRLCLAVAKELETAFGGWVPPAASLDDSSK
ncbi:hypothetical protein PUN28_002967 [Cardiocondyla obscurior]|uniref:Amidase domain-containing protein n=1 Tax=Cardiocondyla obscurior TaxID=286306 RepID=A0AAW2GWW7_9HYME